MLGLGLIQMLVVGVFCATVRTSILPCYDESELAAKAQKKLKSHYLHPWDQGLPEETTASDKRCPVGEYAALGRDVKDRSISPWRLVYDTNNNRFPPTLAVAQCLCGGCITFKDNSGGAEDFTFNSREIGQSRIVLMKQRCNGPGDAKKHRAEDGKKYRLVPFAETVAVGCTCVKPN